jgi:predicted KAP-like P-loop ATPase
MTKERTVEDLAAEITALVKTDPYEAFSRLEDEATMAHQGRTIPEGTQFVHLIGEAMFITTVYDGEIVSMYVSSVPSRPNW